MPPKELLATFLEKVAREEEASGHRSDLELETRRLMDALAGRWRRRRSDAGLGGASR